VMRKSLNSRELVHVHSYGAHIAALSRFHASPLTQVDHWSTTYAHVDGCEDVSPFSITDHPDRFFMTGMVNYLCKEAVNALLHRTPGSRLHQIFFEKNVIQTRLYLFTKEKGPIVLDLAVTHAGRMLNTSPLLPQPSRHLSPAAPTCSCSVDGRRDAALTGAHDIHWRRRGRAPSFP